MPTTVTVLRNARIPGRDGLVDVVLDESSVVALVPTTTSVVTGPAPIVVDVEGRWVIPGLWDEHTHMLQWSLAQARVDVSAAQSAAEVAQAIGWHLGVLPESDDGAEHVRDVVVGFGFRDAMWPDRPTRALLDEVAGPTPVVIASGDGHCGWVSTAAAELLGADVDASGILREDDWFDVSRRLDRQGESDLDGLVVVAGTYAAARGIVGVVDLEMADNTRAWQRRVAAGATSLRVEAGFYADRLDEVIAAGYRAGDVVPDTGDLVRIGPLKIMSDGSLNTRTAFCRTPYVVAPVAPVATEVEPVDSGVELVETGDTEVEPVETVVSTGSTGVSSTGSTGVVSTGSTGGGTTADPHHGALDVDPDEMKQQIVRAFDAGLDVTVHAIGDAAVHLVLDTFEEIGRGGRMEHAQLVDPADLPRFAALGVTASIQPEHAMDDRDVVDAYWEGTSGIPFPVRSLVDAGATVRFGSDAPVAALDPWATMAAAVHRSRDDRDPWHPEETVDARTALAAHARGRDEVRAGDVADLVVVDRDPFAPGEPLRDMPVWATMVGGRWTYRA
ncbi:hypothetical protein SAMN04489860_1029 [Paraoerskovia marina]|uniref:Amidohydrolase 3 domain-containing protein n=1 Tax=Paraoerskovia marina TaxID=545619 RepID=A0A1H1QAR0_9CELL|nr:amidohydrolase family protein [Paraoerskovia marina]SDS20377.1 hypothetical protein SAMN04489860_1029 [Paraoerskovia marina]